MAGFLRQVGVLLYKNFLLQKNQAVATIISLIIPVVTAVIILALGLLVGPVHTNNQDSYSPWTWVRKTCGFSREHPGVAFTPGIIGFAPDTNLTNSLMSRVADFCPNATFRNGSASLLKGFSDMESMLNFYHESKAMQLAVHFKGMDNKQQLPLQVSYDIRDTDATTGVVYRRRFSPLPNVGNERASILANLQLLLTKAFIDEWGGKSSEFGMRYVEMPRPAFVHRPYHGIMQSFFALALVLSLVPLVYHSTKKIVFEKEEKLKESFKMMGVSPGALWVSWFATIYVYLFVIMAVYTAMLAIPFFPSGYTMFIFLQVSVFWVFALIYSAAVASYCLMMGTVLKKARYSGVLAGFLFLVTVLLHFHLDIIYLTLTRRQKLASCLLFNQAMAFGVKMIVYFDVTNAGLSWSNFYKPLEFVDDLSMLDVWVMLLVDTALHLLVTWYLDNVFPGDFGIPKPFHFFLTKSYWCGTQSPNCERIEGTECLNEKFFEPAPADLDTGIRTTRLCKDYGMDNVAVRDLSVEACEGQITVLLGHCGAGKTTTMSMLTGFTAPTSGTATIRGMDICTDTALVRQSMGMCPQHNVFFTTLTVEQNLKFFALLKGCPCKLIQSEVDQMLKEAGLHSKRKTSAGTLSRGEKRKMSVAIALIHGSKVVILDEPSSGLGPAARRQLWHILKQQREGRTILLTTQSMDEADVLGDRIMIMAQGVVKCCGTPLFLKELYGVGYHLAVVKTIDCDVSSVTNTICEMVPSAYFEKEDRSELSYLLPDNQSAKFPELLHQLEKREQQLGIGKLVVTATTMEEVFLKVGERSDTDDTAETNTKAVALSEVGSFVGSSVSAAEREWSGEMENSDCAARNKADANDESLDLLALSRGYSNLTGVGLKLSQLRGLLMKKAICSWRSPVTSIVQILLPVIFTLSVLVCTESDMLRPFPEIEIPEPDSKPSVTLDMAPFSETIVPYIVTKLAGESDLPKLYLSQFDDRHRPTEVKSLDQLNRLIKGTRFYDSVTKMIIGAAFETSEDSSNLAAFALYNPEYYAKLIASAYVLNAVAKERVNASINIVPGVRPFPRREYEDLLDQNSAKIKAISTRLRKNRGKDLTHVMVLLISIGMSFLAPTFVFSLMKEREVGSKHLQRVNSASPFLFWFSNLLWDMFTCLPAFVVMLIVFKASDFQPYSEETRPILVFLLLLLYSWAMLPYNYAIHFLMTSPWSCMVVLFFLHLLGGVAAPICFFLDGFGSYDVTGSTVRALCKLLSPGFNLVMAMAQIPVTYMSVVECEVEHLNKVFCKRCCLDFKIACDGQCTELSGEYWKWDTPGVGKFLVFLLLQGFVFFLLTVLIESRCYKRILLYLNARGLWRSHNVGGEGTTAEDNDVAEEKRRIKDTPATELCLQDSVLLKNLTKSYGSMIAVDNVCVGVGERECFGLLGQNGAGGSTIFKMLTGEEVPTRGEAYVKGYSVVRQLREVRSNIGYCPQTDPLTDQMTCRETLTLYARLRGVPDYHIKDCVNGFLDILALTPHASKLTKALRGGVKRTLTTALALIGDPPVILLDEPSTGLDSAARRRLWGILSAVRAGGRTLVLTSRSVEECEALCTRVAIMGNGRLLCLGSVQRLKAKFAQGYTLVVRMGLQEDGQPAPTGPLLTFVQQRFPSALVFDSDNLSLDLQVPDPSLSVADLFQAMERAKDEFHVKAYSVHQTTLEQVFCALTAKQSASKCEG
ncbi:phospholipid-transporting ATPase ABCA3-like [Littorina saxatilis]|uniref:ABC transporter domain-containing protein n=1 Tax=Littorina saxatilis TaxID=31220 RepID=A0AAN9AR51_9CAEN